MDSYTKRKVVGVGIEVRSHGYAVRDRNRYRKWWVLKNVTFTLGTESPRRAPPRVPGSGSSSAQLPR